MLKSNMLYIIKPYEYIHALWNLYLMMRRQKNCFPLCQPYKPTIILNYISKKRTNIQGASG